jgi:hypothetical protein
MGVLICKSEFFEVKPKYLHQSKGGQIGHLGLCFVVLGGQTKQKKIVFTLYRYHFLYTGALSCGHVTVTGDDCRLLLHNYRHFITQQLYQLWKINPGLAYLLELFLMSCLFSSDEHHIPVGP